MVKKLGPGGIIAAAMIFGLVTMYFLWAYLKKIKDESESNWQPVVVAVVEIKGRTTITENMITVTKFPNNTIAENAITDPSEVIGRIAIDKIQAKDQIRYGDLVQKGQAPSLAYEIPPGMRAIAIGAGEVMAVGATIKPGDRVDILATYLDPNSRQETTQMILQNVLILAVNKGETDASGTQGASSSMTLAVSPEDAELLTAADRAGVLRVALRGVEDDAVVQSPGTRTSEILKGPLLAAIQNANTSNSPVFLGPSSMRRGGTPMTVIRGVQETSVAP